MSKELTRQNKKPMVSAKQVQEWREAILADPQYEGKLVPSFVDNFLAMYAADNGRLYEKVKADWIKKEAKEAKAKAKEAIRERKEEGLKNLQAEKNVPIDHKDEARDAPVQPLPDAEQPANH